MLIKIALCLSCCNVRLLDKELQVQTKCHLFCGQAVELHQVQGAGTDQMGNTLEPF